jgi:hypothetical protein
MARSRCIVHDQYCSEGQHECVCSLYLQFQPCLQLTLRIYIPIVLCEPATSSIGYQVPNPLCVNSSAPTEPIDLLENIAS